MSHERHWNTEVTLQVRDWLALYKERQANDPWTVKAGLAFEGDDDGK